VVGMVPLVARGVLFRVRDVRSEGGEGDGKCGCENVTATKLHVAEVARRVPVAVGSLLRDDRSLPRDE
jgi:hypothetical protein